MAVDALEAMAHSAGMFDGIICPMQDARAGQVYGAAFTGDAEHRRRMEDTPIKLEEYVMAIQALGERFLFLGDGMPVHREQLAALLGERAVFAQPPFAFLRPAAVAYLGAQVAQIQDYLDLMPMYLRAPNAERNKKLMEATARG